MFNREIHGSSLIFIKNSLPNGDGFVCPSLYDISWERKWVNNKFNKGRKRRRNIYLYIISPSLCFCSLQLFKTGYSLCGLPEMMIIIFGFLCKIHKWIVYIPSLEELLPYGTFLFCSHISIHSISVVLYDTKQSFIFIQKACCTRV